MLRRLRRPARAPGARELPVTLTVNGAQHSLRVAPDATLLDVLRGPLQLTGAKPGCRVGECGACTVLVDGRPTYACTTLAARVRGEVRTAEGLAAESAALRQRFADSGAFQCGYCTPGLIVQAYALTREERDLDEDEVRRRLSGNICRCTGYQAIVEAVLRAREGAGAR